MIGVPPSDSPRNLVVVRAGKNSLHPRWLDAERSSNWDLIVSIYDPDVSFRHDDKVKIVVKAGGKWDGIHAVFADSDLLSRYDYVWLPDDDIETTSHSIDAIFETMRNFDLDVAQPSLTRDSYFSHFALLCCPGFHLRYSNFIEIMAPCLKSSVLRSTMDDLCGSMSGYGLDYIWCRLASENHFKAAIIDHVAVRHTRPVGRVLRTQMMKQGLVAEDEEQTLRFKYNVTERIGPLIYAAIDERQTPKLGMRRLGLAMAAAYLSVYSEFTVQESAIWKIIQLIRRQMTRRLDLTQLRKIDNAALGRYSF